MPGRPCARARRAEQVLSSTLVRSLSLLPAQMAQLLAVGTHTHTHFPKKCKVHVPAGLTHIDPVLLIGGVPPKATNHHQKGTPADERRPGVLLTLDSQPSRPRCHKPLHSCAAQVASQHSPAVVPGKLATGACTRIRT